MSTHASFLRQLGGHQRAAEWDGRALLSADTVAAVADALIGLAADALGVGRFAASRRLLDRAAAVLAAADDARLPVRLQWVSAELAMVQGDGATAVLHAERAVAAAAEFTSLRHRVKSDVVLAAALCSRGELDRCRAIADAALDRAGALELVPLRWALASLLADIGSAAYTPGQVTDFRDGSADTVRHRGGVWSGR
jgi:ATP/maltotriose-dependent transcriptional regulator MalT